MLFKVGHGQHFEEVGDVGCTLQIVAPDSATVAVVDVKFVGGLCEAAQKLGQISVDVPVKIANDGLCLHFDALPGVLVQMHLGEQLDRGRLHLGAPALKVVLPPPLGAKADRELLGPPRRLSSLLCLEQPFESLACPLVLHIYYVDF